MGNNFDKKPYNWYYNNTNYTQSQNLNNFEWVEFKESQLIENGYRNFLYSLATSNDINYLKHFKLQDSISYIDFERNIKIINKDTEREYKICRTHGDPIKNKNTLEEKEKILSDLKRFVYRMTDNSENIANFLFLESTHSTLQEYLCIETVIQITNQFRMNTQSKEDLTNISIDYINMYENDKKKEEMSLNEFIEDIYSEKINPIYWYRKDSFVYRMLNENLRKQDIIDIFKLRHYISILRKELQIINLEQKSEIKNLYKVIFLPKKNLQDIKNQINKIFNFKCFFSATGELDAAKFFIKNKKYNECEPVLLVFEPDKNDINKFCSIKGFSKFYYEDEYLININVLFKITKIEYVDDSYYEMVMKFFDFNELTSTENKKIFEYKEIYKNISKRNHNFDAFYIADILMELRKGYDIIRLFQNFNCNKEYDNYFIDNYLGFAHEFIEDYEKSLECFYKVLNFKEKSVGAYHKTTAILYHTIGTTYKNKGDYSKALEFFTKALNIFETIYKKNSQILSISYTSIGIAYKYLEEYDKALEYFYKAINIEKLSQYDSLGKLAISYNNLGATYHSKREYGNALEYYTNALKIYEKKLGNHNLDIATIYNNLGTTFHDKGDYDIALENFKKSLDICIEINGNFDSETAISYNNIGLTYYSMGEYVNALVFFTKAMKINEKIFGCDCTKNAYIYYNIGKTYHKQNFHSKAYDYLSQALKILEVTLNDDNFKKIKIKKALKELEKYL